MTRISSIPNENNSNGQMIEIIKLTNNKNNENYDCWLFPSLQRKVKLSLVVSVTEMFSLR
jgi:hypothetical protein